MSVNSIDNNVDNNNNNNVDNNNNNNVDNNNNKPEKINPWDTVWHDKKNRNSFILHKTDGSTLHIKIGDWIKVPGRDDAVMIDSIVYPRDIVEDGPRGITYLPWRYDEKHFASIKWTIKGNQRYIICYPCGRRHYGGHIDWDKFELGEPPANIDMEMVKEVLDNANLMNE